MCYFLLFSSLAFSVLLGQHASSSMHYVLFLLFHFSLRSLFDLATISPLPPYLGVPRFYVVAQAHLTFSIVCAVSYRTFHESQPHFLLNRFRSNTVLLFEILFICYFFQLMKRIYHNLCSSEGFLFNISHYHYHDISEFKISDADF